MGTPVPESATAWDDVAGEGPPVPTTRGLRTLYVAFTRPTRRLTVLHAAWLPEDTLGVKVEVKVARFDDAPRTGLFDCLTFRGLTVGKPGLCGAFGEGPLAAAIGSYQQKFNGGAAPAIADGRNLQRHRL